MELYENVQKCPRALLVGLDTGNPDFEISLEELYELAATAGAEVEASVVQRRPSPDSATCVGSGRLEEISQFCADEDIDLIIFDCELTPTQLRNIESATNVRTIDRTILILDIFAARARTSEGKLQTELAQLKYLLPRLTGKGIAMSRQGGGIGTRGPGETKLETDKRHIKTRIEVLKERLEEVEKRRDLQRIRRRKDSVTTVALVGYTNAGKSTLMNRLTGADVFAQDMLFATLDATTRALVLPDGREVLLTDTVGFIRNLPHHLINAFKSTLEEVVYADLIVNVCDGSSPEVFSQIDVTMSILKSLGADTDKVITAVNKCDAEGYSMPAAENAGAVRLSAKTGEGADELLELIARRLPAMHKRVTLLVPYSDAGAGTRIRSEGTVFSEEYTQDGILTDALVEVRLLDSLKDYIV